MSKSGIVLGVIVALMGAVVAARTKAWVDAPDAVHLATVPVLIIGGLVVGAILRPRQRDQRRQQTRTSRWY